MTAVIDSWKSNGRRNKTFVLSFMDAPYQFPLWMILRDVIVMLLGFLSDFLHLDFTVLSLICRPYFCHGIGGFMKS